MATRRGPARWPLVVLALLFVGGGVAGTVFSDDDEDGDAPTPDEEGGRELVTDTTEVPTRTVEGDLEPIGSPPETYALTYRVEGFAPGGDAVIDVEHRRVVLPFSSRVESGPDEEGAALNYLQIASLGALQTGDPEGTPAALASEPVIAPGSAHVSGDAAADVLEWRHEVRTILDRDCQVLRAAGPMDVADLAPPAPNVDSHADLCVSDAGVVLQEDWVVDGSLFRRRTAVELDEGARIDDAVFEATGVRPPGNSGGTFVELTADSRPPEATYWELPSVPLGHVHAGRYAFSPPRGDDDQSLVEIPRVAVVIDVYEDGDGGAIIVANGGTVDGTSLFTPGGGEVVDLGDALGEADVLRGLRQSEVRVALERGRFVRVYGSAAVDELVALARMLRANDEPGTITTKP